MSKEKTILIAALALFTVTGITGRAFGYDLYSDMHRSSAQPASASEDGGNAQPEESANPAVYKPKTALDFYSFVPIAELYVPSIDNNSTYYSNPTVKSAIYKYKKGNYTGCLQELYAYIKKHPADAYAFYYMGMAYTKIGEYDVAQKCFQKTINCYAKGRLLELAVKGRDCLSGGPYCHEPINPPLPTVQVDPSQDDPELDAFINAPYRGHGFSPALEKEYKQQQLNNMQKTINRKEKLDRDDIDDIKQIERNKTEGISGELLAMAADITSEPTNEQILDAIDVLKRSGLNISTGALPSASSSAAVTPTTYVNPEYESINMMLGNNNNNNDAMTNMLPYMLSANNDGKNVDPQVIQAVMMNSMMNSLGSLNSTDNK